MHTDTDTNIKRCLWPRGADSDPPPPLSAFPSCVNALLFWQLSLFSLFCHVPVALFEHVFELVEFSHRKQDKMKCTQSMHVYPVPISSYEKCMKSYECCCFRGEVRFSSSSSSSDWVNCVWNCGTVMVVCASVSLCHCLFVLSACVALA